MGRRPCCSKEAGLNRGAWTPAEDKILTEYIGVHGEGKWRDLPERAGLKRCGKSCRLRWMNYLRPGIKRGSISPEEEDLILRLHKLLGNRWTLIAGRLPGRTDNEIKNYWNTKLAKKVNNTRSGSKVTKKQNQSAPKPRRQGDTKTSAVRTKATRSAKPIIIVSSPSVSEGEKLHEQLGQSCSSSSTTSSTPGTALSPSSSMNFEENDQLADFVMDFEMDQHFLSDFLDTDWSALRNSENYGGDQSSPVGNIYDSDRIISSPAKSDKFPSEETPDFEALVSLIDIDQLDNWLQV